MQIAQDKFLAARVGNLIRIVKGFPRGDIGFRDISPVVENDPELFRLVIESMARLHEAHPPDSIVCIESWGYIFGAPVAYLLGSRLCVARRAGKLPRKTIKQDYIMCYAQNRVLEIHDDVLRAGYRVLIVDDVIASGGSALAALKLVETTGAKCIGIACLAAFPDGPFTAEIEKKGIPIHAIASL